MRTLEEIKADIKKLNAKLDAVYEANKDLDDASFYFSDFKRGFAKTADDVEISKWLDKAKSRFNQLFALAQI